ncbi:small ribosomal subunit protein mS37 [Rhynchophorus ferrugineus]|uniref:small ribosomal subunit protein mS37 n=1 Tax=Rhynchophorus ferrugineus TaxID=354439 RepID=UPI003FCD0231
MRIFPALMRKRNIPQDPVAFREILPLKLKQRLSGKSAKGSEVCCLYEMSVVFACLKDHDFNQSLCSKEIEAFQKCYMKNINDVQQKRIREAKGILTPGDKNLTPKQLNILLQRYPNV